MISISTLVRRFGRAALAAVLGLFSANTFVAGAEQPDFVASKYYAVGFSRQSPAFSWLTVDSLGQGKHDHNPVIVEAAEATSGLKLEDRFVYTLDGKPIWRIVCEERSMTLVSEYVAGAKPMPFTISFSQKLNHATLLGWMDPGERRMNVPCVLHLPDMGSMRITANARDLKLGYDARRHVPKPFVQVSFPPATAQQPRVEYKLETAAIYPHLPGIENDPRFDGFKRDFLNIFQVNPRVRMLANNASSDPVAFTVYEYSEMARHAPALADGLTCLDLVRMTLDEYLGGAKGYGQVGYGCTANDADLIAWTTPWTSMDSLPSLLLAACDYIEGAKDQKWAAANYAKLVAWAREMMSGDKNGNGLLEYPGTGNYGDRPLREKRPSNWWDTINFGHEDAYGNALAYHACQRFAAVAAALNHADDAAFLTERAAKLRAAFVPTFLNPATGVLAGWKSADGQLHDYWFTYVQGAAIAYGLVDDKDANAIMDRLLAKMNEAGYKNFSLGLPGNLVPVKKGDYVYHNSPPEKFGEPKLEDGSDGFQFYENGGATGCFSYFTIKALYQLGRREDARRIFFPMLIGYADGNFQGFGENGMSRDWRDWQGGCHGYEGLLVDNYYALLAVFDELRSQPATQPPATRACGTLPGLSQKDGVVYKDGQPYRGVGCNYFDLFLRLLHKPADASSLAGLQRLGDAGIPFVRFSLSYGEADFRLFFDKRDEYLSRLDQVVQAAERAHVGLVPSFFWSFMSFPDLASEPRDQWGNPQSKTHELMRQFVGAIIERYKNSPAIWAYEFGNEPNLMADLPNAANFRKKGGTERDDLKAAALVVMLSEFAKEVRRHDPSRPIIAGHSHPRASSWHNTAEKSWKPDSREQTMEIIRRDNPDPLDTVAIHIYASHDTTKELAAWAPDHATYLRAVRDLANQMKRPIFVGEFGLASKTEEAAAREKFIKLLGDLESSHVDLAAFWVFDLAAQNADWNVTFDNARSYMISLTAQANRRWNEAASKQFTAAKE